MPGVWKRWLQIHSLLLFLLLTFCLLLFNKVYYVSGKIPLWEEMGQALLMAVIGLIILLVTLIILPSSYRPLLRILLSNNPSDSDVDKTSSHNLNGNDRPLVKRHLNYHAHLLENIQESVVVINMNGQIDYMNRQARYIFGYSDYSSLNIRELTYRMDKYHPSIIELIKSTVVEKQMWQGEISLMVEGKQWFFRHHVKPLENNGQIVAMVLMSTDINDLVEARERSESANMAKSQFLANMSHEIRTPMIGILGSVDLLEQSRLSNDQEESVQIIRECGEQLLAIINDILDVSKIEVGLLHLNPQPCSLVDLLTRTLNIIDPMLKEKGLGLKLEIAPDIPQQVILDCTKLRQVLINILYNSVKFTQRGGIFIRAELEENLNQAYLLISIRDTGIGIPAQQIQTIFAPFTQVDGSTSRGFGGTGLGLYICKRLIELMEGELWVESMEGEGTAFSFTVPLFPCSEQIAAETHEIRVGSHQSDDLALEFNPIEILVVEDNDLNRKIVSQMLTNYGFQVSTAANGLECLQILQNRHFDTILMDMQMPIMDGYEATRLIRETSPSDRTPIIAMTANALTGDREKCLAAGCTSYIAKPFKAEDLVQEIRQFLVTNHCIPSKNQAEAHLQLIAELIPEFLEQLEELIADLDQALSQHDLSRIQSIAHDIKGTAGMYGYAEVSRTAASIEQSARDRSIIQIRILIEQLQRDYKYINSQVV